MRIPIRSLGPAVAIISIILSWKGTAQQTPLPEQRDLMAAKDETQRVAIYQNNGRLPLDNPPADAKVLILDVPKAFRYGIHKSVIRDFGLNLLTYYPTFTSLSTPENKRFGLDCAGICNGRILVSVENAIEAAARLKIPSRADFVASQTIKYKLTPPFPANIRVTKLENKYHFDEAYQEEGWQTGAPIGPVASRTERFYFKRAAGKSYYDLTATCVANAQRTTCILYFSLRCNPGIDVSVNGVDGSFLPSAEDIRDKTDAFISAMVEQPVCNL
jgi:hypothetical protein